MRPPPDECAQCGAEIPRRARACPECGADERTGWREASVYDGLDLPAAAYADAGDDERGTKPAARVNGIAWYWWAVGVALIALLGLGALGLR